MAALVGWLGHPVFPVVAIGLVGLWTSLLILSLLAADALPTWTTPFLRLCGYDPLQAAAPAGRVFGWLGQHYLTALVIGGLLWGDLQAAWRRWRSARVGLLAALALPPLLTVAALLAGRLQLEPTASPPVRQASPAPDFQLLDQDEQIVRLGAWRGQVVVLTFFYTHCADTCPLLLSRLRALLATDALNEPPVMVLAITLDPDRDRPTVLADYARRWQLDPARFRLLTGAPAALAPVWTAYGLTPQRSSDGALVHESRVVLIDRQGRLAYTFTGADLTERWLENAIRQLQREPL
jgi:protein SCO1/2